MSIFFSSLRREEGPRSVRSGQVGPGGARQARPSRRGQAGRSGGPPRARNSFSLPSAQQRSPASRQLTVASLGNTRMAGRQCRGATAGVWRSGANIWEKGSLGQPGAEQGRAGQSGSAKNNGPARQGRVGLGGAGSSWADVAGMGAVGPAGRTGRAWAGLRRVALSRQDGAWRQFARGDPSRPRLTSRPVSSNKRIIN